MQIGKIPLSASNFKLNRIGGSIRGSPKMIKIPRTLTVPEFAGHDLTLLRYEGFAHGAGILSKLEELKEFFREPDITLPTYIDLGDGEFWGIPKRFNYQKDGGYKDYWTFTLETLWNDVTGPINRQGLVLELLIDEGEGSTVYDTSGNGNHGTITGTEWVEEYLGKALDFDGSADKVSIPNHSSLNNSSFSVSFYVKPDQIRVQGIVGRIGWDWRVFMRSDGALEFDSTGEIGNILSDVLSAGKYYYIVVTYDNSLNTAKIYQNGILKDTATSATYPNDSGNIELAYNVTNRLDGIANELCIWNRALFATEIYANSRRYIV